MKTAIQQAWMWIWLRNPSDGWGMPVSYTHLGNVDGLRNIRIDLLDAAEAAHRTDVCKGGFVLCNIKRAADEQRSLIAVSYTHLLRTVRQSVCAAQGRTGGRRSAMGVRETGAARRGSCLLYTSRCV